MKNLSQLKAEWNIFLAQIEAFEASEEKAVLGDSAFTLDGELKGCRETYSSEIVERDAEMRGFFEADLAGCGIEDGAGFDDGDGIAHCSCSEVASDGEAKECDAEPSPRWAHERDAHHIDRQRQRALYVRSMQTTDPRGTYLTRCAHERATRWNRILKWVRRAPLSKVLAYRKVARKLRNESIAKTLGFEAVPRGPWPGVCYDDTLGLIRRYRDANNVTVTRIADLSRIYLTKKQLRDVEWLVAERAGEHL